MCRWRRGGTYGGGIKVFKSLSHRSDSRGRKKVSVVKEYGKENTHGSIINPASRAAVVDFKPTVGVVSRHGVYPDPRDEHDVVRPQDYTEACASNDLRGLRIGVPRHVLSSDAVKARHLDEALSVLSRLGATIVDNVGFSEFRKGYYGNNKDEWECSFLVELRQNMKDYLAGFEKNPLGLHSPKDIMNHTTATPSEAEAEYGMEAWRRAERFSQETPPGSSKYHSSQKRRQRMAKQIPELLDRTECDLIVLTGATDTTAEVGGCPCLSVPLGRFPDDQKLEKNKFGHCINRSQYYVSTLESIFRSINID
ncbi:uncharacterized protein NECHADRAFT_77127 [Fusarium vanettenii 77-13-4]|uniref:Uncharacterized protein n=1 Tax=Fusarium vanettenii (strain ATCC MYA-4622 / CBS 123669 / FGSC 9596 / NRRL 45880 / 77-13-4) TaxID=660122 RepID=C7ZCP9_FUSV7|nr:uncharacterized protein NECHADRAFT_77127 [Fusarium vanettenii 77-13-4]EEU38406.1 hypothetical protein NECHADRAFT_77127 [Fusarium vanettenii 77-13-4]